MIGVSDDVTEPIQELGLPPVSKVDLTTGVFPIYVARVDKQGATIMVLGDSFTVNLFAPLLLIHAGQVIWQHHNDCGFDGGFKRSSQHDLCRLIGEAGQAPLRVSSNQASFGAAS
jgi:hypothetical protein